MSANPPTNSCAAGVDGCKGGWVVAISSPSRNPTVRVVKTFAEVLSLPEAPGVIAVDIPIGLLDHAIRGGRPCDQESRGLLGAQRCRSVFSPPVRAELGVSPFAAACAANRASSAAGMGITQQAFNIFDKIEQVDRAMTPALQSRVFEVHPELCLFEMAAGRPAQNRKKSALGRAERQALLAAVGFSNLPKNPAGAATDDMLDAIAACWTASRIQNGTAIFLPTTGACTDSRNLRMQIWR